MLATCPYIHVRSDTVQKNNVHSTSNPPPYRFDNESSVTSAQNSQKKKKEE